MHRDDTLWLRLLRVVYHVCVYVDTLLLSLLPEALHPQHNSDNNEATPEHLEGECGLWREEITRTKPLQH